MRSSSLRGKRRRSGGRRVGGQQRQSVGDHGLRGARAEDQAFEQRVRSQPVGAVDAGAGGFARGIEAAQAGAAGEVGADAAHQVVRRRAHGNQIARQVEAVLRQKCADAGKALVKIEARARGACRDRRAACVARRVAHAFARDGAGHHIARSQLEQRMVALHEALAAIVAQVGAFAAQRFREQKARRAGKGERRGMELVELHVGQLGAGLPRPGRCRRRWPRRGWWCRSRPGPRRLTAMRTARAADPLRRFASAGPVSARSAPATRPPATTRPVTMVHSANWMRW